MPEHKRSSDAPTDDGLLSQHHRELTGVDDEELKRPRSPSTPSLFPAVSLEDQRQQYDDGAAVVDKQGYFLFLFVCGGAHGSSHVPSLPLLCYNPISFARSHDRSTCFRLVVFSLRFRFSNQPEKQELPEYRSLSLPQLATLGVRSILFNSQL